MEKFKEKEWNDFMKKVLREVPEEEPSKDFTASVIGKIRSGQAENVIRYRPLIPKAAWGVLLALFCLILTLGFSGEIHTKTDWLSYINWDADLLTRAFESMGSVKVPTTYLYAAIALAMAILVQLYLITSGMRRKISLP